MGLLFFGKHAFARLKSLCGIVLLMSLILPGFTIDARAGEDWQLALDYQERMRVLELTRNLDATYMQRRAVVNEFVKLGKGPHHKLVQDQLVATLAHGNLLVRESVMEIMARIGSPVYVETLAEVLPFEMFHQNRLILLRLLPSFLVRDDTHRQGVVDALYDDNNTVTDWLPKLLRQEPLDLSGKDLDRRQAQVRKRIIVALAGQLDPIGAALHGYDTKRYNTVAREFIFRVLQEHLLGSRQESLEKWMFLRPTAQLKDIEFVEQTQETASRMLVKIGATAAWKDILALGSVQRPEAREMALAAFAKLSAYAHRNWARNEAILRGATLQARDIFDWREFCKTFSSLEKPAQKTALPFLARIWQSFPEGVRQAIATLNQTGRPGERHLAEAQKSAIVATLNKVISNPHFCRGEGDFGGKISNPEIAELVARKEEGLSASQARHLNRLLLEALFPLGLRRHSSWREPSVAERTWRKEQQGFCEQTVASAYKLASNILADKERPASEDIRSQAYRALGASRRPEAIVILRNDALRAGTSPRLRSDICRALGEIGGVEAVRLLGQLAQYKGYSSQALARRDEYQQVCAALQALGRILARWDDPGSGPALEELLRLLMDKSTIPELPDLPPISRQALYQLQKSLQVGLMDLTPRQWRDYQKKFYLKNAGAGITSIPEPRTPPIAANR